MAAEVTEVKRGMRKTRQGVVVSDRMNKTVVVSVMTHVRHELYGKTIRKAAKYYAHNEDNQARSGDVVRIMETRPMSRLKRWRVCEVVRKADQK